MWPQDIEISLDGLNRSGRATNMDKQIGIHVSHYGIENNTLYSQLSLYNYSDENVYFSFEPSAKKIIRSYTKKKDEMPTMNLKSCTEVIDHVTVDSIHGKVYRTPRFYENQACVDSNEVINCFIISLDVKSWARNIIALHTENPLIKRVLSSPQYQIQFRRIHECGA